MEAPTSQPREWWRASPCPWPPPKVVSSPRSPAPTKEIDGEAPSGKRLGSREAPAREDARPLSLFALALARQVPAAAKIASERPAVC